MSEHFPVLIILVPLLSALVIFLTGLSRREAGEIHPPYAWYISVAASFIAFAISLHLLNTVADGSRISYWLGGWEPPWGIEYVVDVYSGYVLAIISFIAFMIAIFSGDYVTKQVGPDKEVNFYAVYMLLVTGLLGMVITGDIFNVYVFLEIASLSGYALVAVGKKRGAIVASYNYLILGTVGAVFVLLGIGHLYMVTGTLNMADLSRRLPELYHSRVVLTAFAFFVVGFGLKFALFPLHTWLLSAHSLAPSAVSAILAAAVLKVNLYALIRVMFTVYTPEFVYRMVPVSEIFFVIAPLAILSGSIMAIAQTNIKRMLAYSSIGQIGYIILGVALANETALTGSLLHMLNHALMKGGLFLIAGAIIYKTDIYEIDQLKGMGRRMPFTMAAFAVCGLSMIGVPLTVGFVSKWYLAMGALEAGRWYFVPLVLFSSLLTAVYFWRVIEWIYFHQEPAASPHRESSPSGRREETREASWRMLAPIVILAALCLFFGVFAAIPVSLAQKAAGFLLGGL